LPEADDLRRDPAAVTWLQQKMVADSDVSGQPVDVDHEAGQSDHSPGDTPWRDIAQPD
jgi:hypothetical protein